MPGVLESAGDRLVLDVLHVDRDPTRRRELRDPSAHHTGAENAHRRDGAGLDRCTCSPQTSALTRCLPHVEDVHEVLAHRRHEESGGFARLGREALLDAPTQMLLEDVDDPRQVQRKTNRGNGRGNRRDRPAVGRPAK